MGAASYNVNISGDRGKTWARQTSDHTGTTWTVNTIDADTDYVIAVQTKNNVAVSGWTNSPVNTPEPPAPASVTVTSRSGATLNVSWAAVTGATSYNVRSSADNGATWSASSGVTTGTTTTLALDATKDYVVGAQAVNAKGTSDWTVSSVSYATPLPAAPTNVAATRAKGSVTLTWDAVSGASSYDVACNQYTVSYTWKICKSGVTDANRTATVTTYYNPHTKSMRPIVDTRSYLFAVRARNNSGAGEWTRLTVWPAAPLRIASISAARTASDITLTWTVPAANGGYPIKFMHVQCRTSSDRGTTWSSWFWCTSQRRDPVPGSVHTAVIDSVDEYDSALTYQARARGYNALGYGDWRESAVIEPVTLTASAVTTTTATLTLDGHTGDWWLKETSPSTGTCTAGEADFSHVLSALTGGTAYTYRAYRDSGCATELASATFSSLYPAVTNLTHTQTASNSGYDHTVSWDRPTTNFFTGAVNYVVECTVDSGATWAASTCGPITGNLTGSTASSVTATFSTTGTVGVRVRAEQGADFGYWAAAGAGAKPPAPTGVNAQNQWVWNYGTQIKVWWSRPSGVSSDSLIGYKVECSSNNGTSYSNCATAVASKDASHVVTATSGTNKVRVRSTRYGLNSDWVESSLALYQSGPIAPGYLSVTRSTSGQTDTYVISWNKPGGATGAIGYDVWCADTWGSGWVWHCAEVAPTNDTNVSVTVDNSRTFYRPYTRVYVDPFKDGVQGKYMWLNGAEQPTNIGADYQANGDLKIVWNHSYTTADSSNGFTVECTAGNVNYPNYPGKEYSACGTPTYTGGANTAWEATVSNKADITGARVRATKSGNGMGLSPWENTDVDPAPPTSLSVSKSTSGSTVTYTASWTKASSPSYAVAYTVQCSADNSTWSNCASVAATTDASVSTTFTRTTAQTAWTHVRVRATVGVNGRSDWTTASVP